MILKLEDQVDSVRMIEIKLRDKLLLSLIIFNPKSLIKNFSSLNYNNKETCTTNISKESVTSLTQHIFVIVISSPLLKRKDH